jgi:excisionase family DNA binding protein
MGLACPPEMRFTAAELTEIRHAFRQRLATERVPKKRSRRKRKPRPPLVLIREPDYDDTCILTPALVAELFAVSPRTVRRWADAGTLPSFRTVGGQRRFRWGEIGAWSPDCLRADARTGNRFGEWCSFRRGCQD